MNIIIGYILGLYRDIEWKRTWKLSIEHPPQSSMDPNLGSHRKVGDVCRAPFKVPRLGGVEPTTTPQRLLGHWEPCNLRSLAFVLLLSLGFGVQVFGCSPCLGLGFWRIL